MATIVDVAAALADWPVVWTPAGGSPLSTTAYDFDATPNSATLRTPARILLPLGREATGGRDFTFLGMGQLGETTWQLTDLFLWKPVTNGLSLANVGGDLLRYQTAYREVVRLHRSPAAGFVIERLEMEANAWEWPLGGNTSYFGVACALTIREFTP